MIGWGKMGHFLGATSPDSPTKSGAIGIGQEQSNAGRCATANGHYIRKVHRACALQEMTLVIIAPSRVERQVILLSL